MYEIKVEKSKVKKSLKRLLKKVSPDVRNRLRDTLQNDPYPSSTHGNKLNKIEKKRSVYCYPLTGGDRILFLIYESPKKYIEIIFAGNDDEEIRFLRKKTHRP